jgi:protein-tyrosine phosphatase
MSSSGESKKQLKVALKSLLRDLYWSFYGKKLEIAPMPFSPKSFLFVCRGNICRSPFAEHLAKRIAREKQAVHFRFGSAGIEVGTAVPPPDMAKEVAENCGVNLDGHLSKSIKEIDLKAYDMIIAMEGRQLKDLVGLFPELKNKIFLLPLFKPLNSNASRGFLKYNIPDPYGNGRDEFLRCFNRIGLCVERLLAGVVERMQKEREKC